MGLLDEKKALVAGVANKKSIAWGIAQALYAHGAQLSFTCLGNNVRRVKKLAPQVNSDIIFLFLFIIVFIIVVMSVINTMGMAVLERTREIGTLRALGLKRRGLVLLFAIESTLLGILGTLCGLLMTIFGLWLVDVFEPTWIPPGMTNRVVIKMELFPETMAYIFVFLLVLCLVASLIPAGRAARENIVDALGHV